MIGELLGLFIGPAIEKSLISAGMQSATAKVGSQIGIKAIGLALESSGNNGDSDEESCQCKQNETGPGTPSTHKVLFKFE